MQLSGRQPVSPSMSVLSRTSGPSIAGWSPQRGVPGWSVASRAPLQRRSSTAASQSAQRHIKVLSGTTAQTQTGTKAAAPRQLPELPTLDGKQYTQVYLWHSAKPKQHTVDCILCCRLIPRQSQVRSICQLAHSRPPDGWQIPLRRA